LPDPDPAVVAGLDPRGTITVSHDSDTAFPADIGEILISSRSLEEYRSMFDLSDDDLSRRILDCPAGSIAPSTSTRSGN
jgi:hypothetical protein